MDRLSTENDEFGFDDNGLLNEFLLASRQEKIVSSECICHCDVIPSGRDEDKATKVGFDERKSYWIAPFDDERGTTSFGEPSGSVSVINDNEHTEYTQALPNDRKDSKGSTGLTDNLDLPVCHIFKKEGAENVYGTRSIRWGEVETTEAKFRSGRSSKDRGFRTSSTDSEILSSLACLWATSFAMTSWKLSVSLTVGILLQMPYVVDISEFGICLRLGVEGALTSVPVNALFVVGETARINCSTDLNRPVYWARTLAGSDVQQWLYYGKNGFNGNNADGRFSIDKDETTGRYDVIITDVQPKDAGQYICVDESGLGTKASAEFVVSDPIKCNSRVPSDGVMGYNVFGIEQDFIQVSCSLTYTGNLSPTLQWSWPGSVVQSDENEISAATSSVTSTLKLSPNKEQNNIKFQCKANIEVDAQQTNSGLLWESETVNVRYAEFASEEVDVCPGVKWNLICNPQCSYHFQRNDSDCQCLYTYYDTSTQQKYEVTSDAVRCGVDSDSLQVVLIAVGVVAGLLGTTVIVLACCLKKRNTKRWPSDVSAGSGEGSNDDNSGKAMIEAV